MYLIKGVIIIHYSVDALLNPIIYIHTCGIIDKLGADLYYLVHTRSRIYFTHFDKLEFWQI